LIIDFTKLQTTNFVNTRCREHRYINGGCNVQAAAKSIDTPMVIAIVNEPGARARKKKSYLFGFAEERR
jgi:hypothetical protein